MEDGRACSDAEVIWVAAIAGRRQGLLYFPKVKNDPQVTKCGECSNKSGINALWAGECAGLPSHRVRSPAARSESDFCAKISCVASFRPSSAVHFISSHFLTDLGRRRMAGALGMTSITSRPSGLAIAKPVARVAGAGIRALPSLGSRRSLTVVSVAAPMDMPITEEAAPRFEVRNVTKGSPGCARAPWDF